MGRGGLSTEIWRCAWMVGVFAFIGIIAGQFFALLSFGLFVYLAWIFFNIYHLEEWVHQARRNNAPAKDELQGIWQEIGYDVQLLLARHEKEKQRLQTVVNRVQEMTSALADSVILIDAKGNMEWWNQAAQRLFNFRTIDHGHKLTNLIRHPRFIHYFDGRQYHSPLELTMWQKDQHLEFQVHTFGEGERLVICRDITRLFKLEQMRKDFVANVSHELRTPLTVIRGYIETLADSPNTPPAWAKALQQMEQQGQRMTLLINDLITLAKLETDQKEEIGEAVAIAPMIQGIVNDAKTISGEKNHHFDVSGDPTLAIIGNSNELRSAISNLVVNAINYSAADTDIAIRFNRLSHGASISVCDLGIGIDPKHIPRLTERFYRVDTGRSVAAGGTGLGLAIVKHVLLRHNAELRIESQPGRGSEFSCIFPPSIVTDVITPGDLQNRTAR